MSVRAPTDDRGRAHSISLASQQPGGRGHDLGRPLVVIARGGCAGGSRADPRQVVNEIGRLLAAAADLPTNRLAVLAPAVASGVVCVLDRPACMCAFLCV